MVFQNEDKRHVYTRACFVFLTLFFSCSGTAVVREVPIISPRPQAVPEQPFQQPRPRESSGGVSSDIRALCDQGSPRSLHEALGLLQADNIRESEFGRVMNAVAVTLLKEVYDERLPSPDSPKNHTYSRIISEAERGIYREPPSASTNYLEHILPFLALLDDTTQSRLTAALPDLEKARRLNSKGVLAPYFEGLAAEKMRRLDQALVLYRAALDLASDCYPAAFGMARIMEEQGRNAEAVQLLAALNESCPGSVVIKRELGAIYIRERNWADAARVIDEALELAPDTPLLVLARAQVLFETGQFVQTQVVLDKFAAENPENRDYLLLRARLQNEGFKNRENALNILRPVNKQNPSDFSVALYLTRLLLESANGSEQAEGRTMLQALMRPLREGEDIPIDVILLASEDAVRRSEWQQAAKYQDRILSERRTPAALVNAFRVEQGLGNGNAAFALALELTQNYPDYEEGAAVYAEALIDGGRHGEALRLINARIAALGPGAYKSRYYYLRGSLSGDFNSAVSDFRSALFENPRNLDALKGLVEIYHKRGDERHAVYYLRQAIAIDPKDLVLLQYQKEYEPASPASGF
ncbi:MAG: tetratricopeptide repeat protein [Spirochaetaceae bacterium]|jgi:tetratricopeptide (TPR) repeat protein|nr:tetratricopeptide repeat protein [Spirochaetaceae bacterium]